MKKELQFQCEVKATAAEGGRTRFVAVISSSDVDRQGEIVDPNGATLVKGAQLLYGHDYGNLRSNIGVVTGMRVEGKFLVAEGLFDDTIPEHTDAIIAAGKAKQDPPSLNTLSIGFIPRTVKFANGEVRELKAGEWVWPEPGLTYLKVDITELSFVPVPAHPDTELLLARAFDPPTKHRAAGLVEAMEAVMRSPQFQHRLRAALAESPAPAPGGSGDAAPSDPGVAAPAAPAGAPPDPGAEPAGDAPAPAADVSPLIPTETELDLLLSAEPVHVTVEVTSENEDDLDALFSAEPAVVGVPGA